MKHSMPAPAEKQLEISLARTPEAIERCSGVMRELRPQVSEAAFTARVQVQQREGYHLAFAARGEEVCAVAGFRIFDLLFSGRTLYLDDLVTREKDRGRGCGGALFEWVKQHAVEQGCHSFSLDSGVQRFGAHRFYLKHGMDITAHHFVMELRAK